MGAPEYWNHNVHYQPVILRAVPPACGAALDVGCGDGMLACRLADRCDRVTGIDPDPGMIALARGRANGHGRDVRFIAKDFLSAALPAGSFDFACANTSLHHMDFGAGLAEMARVLRPGGDLAVIGLARNGRAADYLPDLPAIPATLALRAIHGNDNPAGMPVKDPDHAWHEVRATARRILPGVRYRRMLLFRYALRWTKPMPEL